MAGGMGALAFAAALDRRGFAYDRLWLLRDDRMERHVTRLLALAIGWLALTAQILPSDSIQNPQGRSAVSLAGHWRVIVDPLDTGQSTSLPGAPTNGFFHDAAPIAPLNLVEYRFTNDRTLEVPGDWNTQDPTLWLYEGPLWYRTTFGTPPEAASKRQFLYFGAVNYTASVYLNGKLVATHAGGFTPFSVEVTGKLKPNDNLLVVRADNRLGAETVPARRTDWWNYGGITRDVLLVSTPKAFIRDYSVHLDDLKTRRIAIVVKVDGGVVGQTIRVDIPTLKRGLTLKADADGMAMGSFTAPVALWSPQHPTLYKVRLSTADDVIEEPIGFRTIARAGDKLLLNGLPIFLKGINAHEESLLHPGRSFGAADGTATIAAAKALGANFVRLAHYPHDEATLRAADAAGVLVWDEIPVWQDIGWSSAKAYAAAEAQLDAMIARDRNRASVILWSVGNETSPGKDRDAFVTRLIDRAHALDPSRLVTMALIGNPSAYFKRVLPALLARIALDPQAPGASHAAARTALAKLGVDVARPLEPIAASATMLIDDPVLAKLDVIGFNEYMGWYYPAYVAPLFGVDEPSMRRAELALMPTLRFDPAIERPFIISEFGADAIPGASGGEGAVETEAYQAMVYRQQFAMLANSRHLAGMAPWVLKDFRSPKRTRDFYNRKGVIDETGRRKVAFDVLRAFYATR
jgi:beta-glucuronidase